MNVPIYCHACTGRFSVQAAKVTADLTCTSCGSPDIDLDQSPEAPHTAAHTPVAASDRTADSAAFGSPQNSKTASQALCTNCFRDKYDYEPSMGDEGSSFSQGTCSVCGTSEGTVFTPSDDLLAATSAKTADFNDPEMGQVKEVAEVTQKVTCSSCLTEHTVDAVDPAQPLPVCPSCGKDTLSVAGGTVASRKKAAGDGVCYNCFPEGSGQAYGGGECPDCGGTGVDRTPYGTGGDHCPFCGVDWKQPHVGGCPRTARKTVAKGSLDAAFAALTTEAGGSNSGMSPSLVVRQIVDEAADGYCEECGGPKWKGMEHKHQTVFQPLPPQGNPFAASLDQAFTAQRREAKVAEIVAGIRATNPSLSPTEARRVAENTVNRYPQIVS